MSRALRNAACGPVSLNALATGRGRYAAAGRPVSPTTSDVPPGRVALHHPPDSMASSLVRIRDAPATVAHGFAGLVGAVFGFSVPSISGVVPIIGPAPDDFVLNVYIEERRESYWLAPELLDDLGDGTGRTAALEGVPVTWARRADDGTWEERPAGTAPGEVTDPTVLRNLWKHIHRPGDR